jgi:hypothetical protein
MNRANAVWIFWSFDESAKLWEFIFLILSNGLRREYQMRPDPRFVRQSKQFWACVRTVSQYLGYTFKIKGEESIIKIHSIAKIHQAFRDLTLNAGEILDSTGEATPLGTRLHLYFEHRAEVLNNFVRPRLMDAKKAKLAFNRIKKGFPHNCPLPMNKQTGSKKAAAFLTGITNMLIEENLKGRPCNYDPRILTTVTKHGVPVRTLARRVDGAFPDAINPIAIWEIKEYYYTTTFGSRVADGVYETLLDGMELEELAEKENIKVEHYLMLDDYLTWWKMGKSYLCRIVDMLHMGYVDEVLFGAEIIDEMPRIVKHWATLYEQRKQSEVQEPKIV